MGRRGLFIFACQKQMEIEEIDRLNQAIVEEAERYVISIYLLV